MVSGKRQQETSIMSIAVVIRYLNNGHFKVHMPTEKEKWLKFHNGQYQFKVPFMLYADFESILKPVDERYMDRMNTMKT